MTLGEFLREKRQARQLEPVELAKRAGCSRQHLHQIERDEARPGAGVLLALSKQLRLSQEESDQMFALANRLPPDVLAILKERPQLYRFIRENRGRPRRAGREWRWAR